MFSNDIRLMTWRTYITELHGPSTGGMYCLVGDAYIGMENHYFATTQFTIIIVDIYLIIILIKE